MCRLRAHVQRGLTLLALGLSSAACSPDLDVDSCELRCVSECPGEMVCRATFCVAPDYDPMVSGLCAEPLVILAATTHEVMTCEPLEIRLDSVGGRGDIDWTVTMLAGERDTELPSGLEFIPGARPKLSAERGDFSDGSDVVLHVVATDEAGNRAEEKLVLDVQACTRITTQREHRVCAGDELLIGLEARGGSGEYDWQVSEDIDFVSLDEDAGVLVVRVPEEQAEDAYAVQVVAANGERETDRDVLELTLEVEDCPRLKLADEYRFCTDADTSIQLNASGGKPPYVWDVSGLPAGLALEELGDEQAVITGVVQDVTYDKQVVVEIIDAFGRSRSSELELTVDQCPVPTDTLIPACIDTLFSHRLSSDMPSESVVWEQREAQSPPPSWLKFDPGKATVSGVPDTTGEFKLPLSVGQRNSEVSRAADITVRVAPPPCTVVPVVNEVLADGCAGQSYDSFVTVEGGSIARWSKGAGWPDWLDLDQDTGRVRGLPPLGTAADFELGVSLEPSAGTAAANVTLDWHVRRSCKFGFLGQDGGRTRLFLGDGRQPSMAGTSPVDLSQGIEDGWDVSRFAFAPDGTRVAFAAESDAEVDRWWLAPISEFEDGLGFVELPMPESAHSIVDFAWSLDGSRLALLYTTETESYRLSTYEVGSDAVRAGEDEPVSVSDPERLFWLGPDVCYVGLTTVNEESRVAPFCHAVAEDGSLGAGVAVLPIPMIFDPTQLEVEVLTGTREVLVFVSPSEEKYELRYTYHDGSTAGYADHHFGVPDPSFQWLAQPGTQLQRESAEPSVGLWRLGPGVQTYGTAYVAEHSVANCQSIVAWEQTGRALACASNGRLRIALLTERDGELVVDQREVDATDEFESRIGPVAFDAGGGWFVYQAQSRELLAVDTRADNWSAVPVSAAYDVGALVFSPLTEPGSLLVQAERDLEWLELEQASSWSLNGDVLLERPQTCQSDFHEVGPNEWCGYARSPRGYTFFADGSAAVFATAKNELHVTDVRASVSAGEAVVARVNEAVVSCRDLGCSAEVKVAP